MRRPLVSSSDVRGKLSAAPRRRSIDLTPAMRETRMVRKNLAINPATTQQRRGVRTLSELVAGVVAPLADRRDYAFANLAAAWAEVAGPRYADCSAPERIDWPRGKDAAGVLRLRVDGPKAVLLQHELGQLVERVNAFL